MKKHLKYLAVLGWVWIACGILCAIFYVIYLDPLTVQIKDLDKKLREAEQRFAQARAAIREEEQAKLAQELNTLQETIDRFVYPQHKIGQLPFIIGDIAKPFFIDNLNIINKPIGAYTHNNKMKYMTTKHMDIQINGSFHQIAGFLNALERSQPAMIVNDIHLSKPRSQEKLPAGSIELIIMVALPDES